MKHKNLIGTSWRWIDKVTQKDADIIKFAESMRIGHIVKRGGDELIETIMHVTPLGNYTHAANKYSLLIYANRQQVRAIRKVLLKNKPLTRPRKGRKQSKRS